MAASAAVSAETDADLAKALATASRALKNAEQKYEQAQLALTNVRAQFLAAQRLAADQREAVERLRRIHEEAEAAIAARRVQRQQARAEAASASCSAAATAGGAAANWRGGRGRAE